jgi:hypothetical protein
MPSPIVVPKPAGGPSTNAKAARRRTRSIAPVAIAIAPLAKTIRPDSNRLRTLPLEIMEFIRRFLQHVLPTGFMKVRYYGFMNPNCEVSLDRIRALIKISYGFSLVLPKVIFEPRPPITCPSCGGPLKLRSLTPSSRILAWSG